MEDNKEFKELSKKVDRVLFYLESDGTTKQEGLVEKVNRIDSELQELVGREKVYLAKFGMMAVFGGAVVQVFWFVLNKVFRL